MAQSSNAAKGLAAVTLPLCGGWCLYRACLALGCYGSSCGKWGCSMGSRPVPSEKTKIVQLMGIEPSDIARELTVTNAEEHALLGSTVPAPPIWAPGLCHQPMYVPWRQERA